jgi:hypothetical protein
MNYTVIARWTDGRGRHWLTVALADGTRSTHCYTV